jgi:metal-dependent amidase/aminoacylase/carboxypeptidase family protein
MIEVLEHSADVGMVIGNRFNHLLTPAAMNNPFYIGNRFLALTQRVLNGVDLSGGTAMNSFKVEFYGRASHAGASPERGRSALDAAELMNIGANYLREHIIQEARIHYVIENGGVQPNVVPPYARSWYYVRAPLRETVEQIYQRVLKIAEAADGMG